MNGHQDTVVHRPHGHAYTKSGHLSPVVPRQIKNTRSKDSMDERLAARHTWRQRPSQTARPVGPPRVQLAVHGCGRAVVRPAPYPLQELLAGEERLHHSGSGLDLPGAQRQLPVVSRSPRVELGAWEMGRGGGGGCCCSHDYAYRGCRVVRRGTPAGVAVFNRG